MSLYTYSPLHTASTVQPPLGPAASVDGGSSVHVLGSGFGASPTMLCRVGAAEVSPTLAPALAPTRTPTLAPTLAPSLQEESEGLIDAPHQLKVASFSFKW